ncbi:hypothetical protein ANN_01125 [Periplaneta americana]|uniref:Uncharacterized protein n=1 Tax=Periplaneta americana TaxID=6978 RepID=A0ABQ8TUD4_PERAM|nr:hypothetical protein ANN_01125 [Periplaneta americana]
MAGLCESGNEPSGSLKAILSYSDLRGSETSQLESKANDVELHYFLHFINPGAPCKTSSRKLLKETLRGGRVPEVTRSFLIPFCSVPELSGALGPLGTGQIFKATRHPGFV